MVAMPNSEPDYSKYSREELHSVLSHIDREKYPERVKRVKAAIQKLRIRPAKKPEKEEGKTDFESVSIMIITEVAFWLIVLLLCAANL